MSKGFSPIIFIIIIIVAVLGVGAGSYVLTRNASPRTERHEVPLVIEVPKEKQQIPETGALLESAPSPDEKPEQESVPKTPIVSEEPNVQQPEPVVAEQNNDAVRWYNRGGPWQVSGNPPLCLEPLMLKTPVDMNKVSAMLYPGQQRGSGSGSYKPHGGFRFDGAGNTITVVAPMDAELWRGSRYTIDGEVQYLLDFIAPCGIWYRFGHLRVLSPRFAAIVDTLPQPEELNSRTTEFPLGTLVTRGEELATTVRFINNCNSFVDFGVFDLRQKNEASKNPAWAAIHNTEQDQYAICWFDWLPAADAAIAWQLPTGVEGTTSDYCK